MMVAGLVVVAHRSGGPLADIVDTAPDARTGYLARSAQEYADAAWEALALEPQQRRALTDRARYWDNSGENRAGIGRAADQVWFCVGW